MTDEEFNNILELIESVCHHRIGSAINQRRAGNLADRIDELRERMVLQQSSYYSASEIIDEEEFQMQMHGYRNQP